MGKSALVDTAVTTGWEFFTPFTTRPPRPGEVLGRDYHFVSVEQFQEQIRRNAFVEWDFTLGHYYGTGYELFEAVSDDNLVVLHALARIALRLREHFPDAVLVFLDGIDDESLETRLSGRGTSPEEISARRAHWKEERVHAPLFNEIVDASALASTSDQKRLLARLTS